MDFPNSQKSFEETCYEDSHNWFLSNGIDYTVDNGVSIGKVIQLQVFEKLFESSQVNADSRTVRSFLKKLDLEWAVRSIVSFFDKETGRGKSDFLFIFDVNNEPMIQALNILGLYMENLGNSVSAVTIDRTILKKCAVKRKTPWFKEFSILDFFGAFVRYFSLVWSADINQLKNYRYLKRRYGVGKAKSISRYFKFQSFLVLLEIRAAKALLMKKKPKVVILASDAHRVSRTFVFLCKYLDIKTVVYQHGATIWEYGYVPVYADHMLIWANSSRFWFEERGVNPDQLVEIGNLRSDQQIVREFDKNEFFGTRKVYFFPNPIDRNITKKVVSILVDICSRYGMDGIIKLHPSEKNVRLFEDIISHSNKEILIKTGEINDVGISPGDVAIVVNSTAGVDCCLQGAYVFNVEIASMPNPIDYEAHGVGVKSTLENYLYDFDRLLRIPPSKYLENRAAFIKSYLGNLDGKVSERACNFILNLAKNA